MTPEEVDVDFYDQQQQAAERWLLYQRDIMNSLNLEDNLLIHGEDDERIVLDKTDFQDCGNIGVAGGDSLGSNDDGSHLSYSSSPKQPQSPSSIATDGTVGGTNDGHRKTTNVRRLKTRLELIKQRRKHRQVQLYEHPNLPLHLGEMMASKRNRELTDLDCDEVHTKTAYDLSRRTGEDQKEEESEDVKSWGEIENDFRNFILNWGHDDDTETEPTSSTDEDGDDKANDTVASTSSWPSFYSGSQWSQNEHAKSDSDGSTKLNNVRHPPSMAGYYSELDDSGNHVLRNCKDMRTYTLDKLNSLEQVSEGTQRKPYSPSENLRVVSMPTSFVTKYMKRPRRRNILDSILCFDRSHHDRAIHEPSPWTEANSLSQNPSAQPFDEVEAFGSYIPEEGERRERSSPCKIHAEEIGEHPYPSKEPKDSKDYALVRIIGVSRTPQHPWYVNEEDKNEIGDLPFEEEDQPLSCTSILPSQRQRQRNKWYVRPQDANIRNRFSSGKSVKTTDIAYFVHNAGKANNGTQGLSS